MSPILTIILVYNYKLNLTHIITFFIPEMTEHLDGKESLEFTLNVSICTVIISLISELFRKVSDFSSKVYDNEFASQGEINYRPERNSPITLRIDCAINYRWSFLKYLITKLGGLEIVVSFPYWLEIDWDQNTNYPKGAIKDSFYEENSENAQENSFTISLDKYIQKKSAKSKFIIKERFISSATSRLDGAIIPSFVPRTNNKLYYFLICIIIFVFYNLKEEEYVIHARKLD
ncbi:hypothetical protein [Bacillus velezensis]|uniref:hypothetical protein n=1 Tax=Bacillus TaxID=1386 RepID=UPI0021DB62B8|nr:hypothetical protein [Bacillus velezensis]MCU9592817.1 hypothetical protein [Bacillus velezensis]